MKKLVFPRPVLLITVAALVVLVPRPASADEEAVAIRKALKSIDRSVHKVWYRQKKTQSRFVAVLEDDSGGSRSDENEQVCMGIAVDDAGLIVVGGHVFPDPYSRSVNAGMISLSRESSQPEDFRVEVDGEKLPAELVVHDKELNVALLRIRSPEPVRLEPLAFDAKAELDVADRFHVMTMLSEKYEFQKSFRSGRVRAVVGDKKKRYLQNAVSGFAGISMEREQVLGGPVFDDRGRVIGIMGIEPAKPPKERRTTGLNPRDVARQVFVSTIRPQTPLIIRAPELLAFLRDPLGNEKARAWVGLQELQTLTFGMRRHLGLTRGRAMLISLVGHGSPALEAGIRSGDLLIRIDDLEVRGRNEEDLRELRHHVRRLPIGEPVEMEIHRGAEKLTVKVRPRPRPKTVHEAERFENETLGIGVKEITYDMIERKNLDPEDLGRAYVTKVPFGGFFSIAGARTGEMIRVGDVILGVNRDEIRSVADFKTTFKKLEKQKTAEVLVKIKRHADTRFLKVKLDWEGS
jgi:S1-C subfamily serine protease